jgi:hypothetical protein
MVTAGKMEDAPFTIQGITGYNANIYNAHGPQPGGNGDILAPGRSISQFLAGQAQSADPSGGLVAPGWWAIDDFNTGVPNGDELTGVTAGNGRIDDDQTLTGAALGLADSQVTSFTVWFGLHDVAFDTNGDGFTQTFASPQASFNGLSFGTTLASVPEPTSAGLLVMTAAFLLRRKR